MPHIDCAVTDVVELSFLRGETGMGANQFCENSMEGHDVPSVCGVYRITDTFTGIIYVGASINIRTRIIQHFSKLAIKSQQSPYRLFASTYNTAGTKAFTVDILEECAPADLLARELHWLSTLKPPGNTQHVAEAGLAFSEDEREKRSERTKKLWATPEYRARAVASRKGNAYNTGYRCTPEQVLNRKRAARISNVKRNYGMEWRAEYVRRYPEHAGDVDA
jgi:group I intron endonuclease